MTPGSRRSRGGAMVLVLVMAFTLAASYFLADAVRALGNRSVRDTVTASALAQAKEALIGFPATYRNTHPNQVFGQLLCPDINNDGFADPPCANAEVSVIGHLPWRTLGLPPLRDSAGECLWYAVSGHGKDNPPTAAMNWDTVGQFAIQDANGAPLTGSGSHDLALALVFAALAPLGSQNRASTGTNECGGSATTASYLDQAWRL